MAEQSPMSLQTTSPQAHHSPAGPFPTAQPNLPSTTCSRSLEHIHLDKVEINELFQMSVIVSAYTMNDAELF